MIFNHSRFHRIVQIHHKVLGIVLSALFLMWFISGIVLMYHKYPSVSTKEKLARSEKLIGDLLSSDQLDFSNQPLSSLSLSMHGGRPLFVLTSSAGREVIDARTGQHVNRLTDEQLWQEARRWSDGGEILLIDTLNAIDTWLIGVYPKREWPVYHYRVAGDEKREFYLSSRTGEVVQKTTASSRFWAWLGAIPHWIYIKPFRANGRQPWTDIVMWISGIGILMTLTGLYIGVYRTLHSLRRNHTITPYKKRWLRWHHILGISFGWITLTWIFSGFISMTQLPSWVVTVHEGHKADDIQKIFTPESFTLDYRKILQYDDVRRLHWICLSGIPYYKVETAQKSYLVDARCAQVETVELSAADCEDLVRRTVGSGNTISTKRLETYDKYYLSLKRESLPLPVYKIDISDEDNSSFYINPQDGACRFFNNNTRTRSWMYGGLHSFRCLFFEQHLLLHHIVMWLMLIGGVLLSATGFVLAVQRIAHWLKRKNQ